MKMMCFNCGENIKILVANGMTDLEEIKNTLRQMKPRPSIYGW